MTYEELEKLKREFDNSPHYELWSYTFVIPENLHGKHITNATLQELCEKYGDGVWHRSLLVEYADKDFFRSCDHIHVNIDEETEKLTVFIDGIFFVENGIKTPVCYSDGFIPSIAEYRKYTSHYDWFMA